MAPPPKLQQAPLNTVHVDRPLATANRLLAALHLALAAAAIAQHHLVLVMLAADLVLLFLWALSQAPMWRPVTRSAFPGRLSRRALPLPAVDVMVVTADPDKEPTVEVMNTVVSAMALDYPGGRLSVYLSDDAGSPLTLLAARKAYAFARTWVPFCRKYRVQCPCPDMYFAGDDQQDGGDHHELTDERLRIKEMYETFKKGVQEAKNDKSISQSWTKAARQDHDAYVEIITDEQGSCSSNTGRSDDEMPLLVYVSREKRRASPHHFKAGALNALLRVSSLVSNSPYVLVLDCDMHCNNRSSILEAMCFHLDHRLSSSTDLAFVQFPQMFHNLSSNDIYASELRPVFSTQWKGLDGLRGPILSGTGFYVRRDALYGAKPPGTSSVTQEFSCMEVGELNRRFGLSNDIVASVRTLHRSGNTATRNVLPQDAKCVASCAYEMDTKWGKEVGFLYHSVVEDYFTGFWQLYCRGWTSVYCYPSSRPPFLGNVPTNLNDVLVQNKRWMSGLLAVGVSKYCPLTVPKSVAISIPQSMTFAYYAFVALSAFPLVCYATIPQLYFFRGVSLFPKVSSPWFAAVFVSSSLQHLIEVSVSKRRLAVRTWWNEQRFWMLNAVTGQLFACVSIFLNLVGAETVDFDLTNKASNDKLYLDGVFDFKGCSTLLLPATTLCVLNAAALVGGTWKIISSGSMFGELLPQFFLLCYIAALSYPLIEGMFLRQDPARVPARITALSVAVAATLLSLFG